MNGGIRSGRPEFLLAGARMSLWDRFCSLLLWENLAPALAALAMVLILFAGRWTLGRLGDNSMMDAFADNPYVYVRAQMFVEIRLWALIFLGAVSLIYFAPWPRLPRNNTLVLMRLIFLFAAYMAASALWSVEPEISLIKVYELALALLIYYLFLVWQTRCDMRRLCFPMAYGIVGSLAAVGVLTVLLSGIQNNRLSVLGGGGNIFGRLMAFLAVCSLALMLNRKEKAPWAVVGGLAMAMVLASGSRGALLSMLVGGAVYLGVNLKRLKRIAVALAAVAIVLVLAVVFTPVGQAAIAVYEARVLQATLAEGYTSGRDQLAQESLDMWNKSPIFGVGLASFSYLSEGSFVYSHNLFLEALSEGGVLGLTLLLVIFGWFLRILWLRWNRVDSLALSLFALFLVGSQFSGDFYDSRTVFLFMLVVAAPVEAEARRQSALPEEIKAVS